MKKIFNFFKKQKGTDAEFGADIAELDLTAEPAKADSFSTDSTESKSGNLIFGASWIASLNDSKEEFESLARSEDAQSFVSIESSANPPTYGFYSGRTEKKTRYISGAMAFHLYSEVPNKVLIHPKNPASSVLVIVSDGIPTLDQILQSSEAVNLLQEQISAWTEARKPFEIFGLLPETATIDFPVNHLSLSSLEIFACENPRALFKPVKKSQLVKYGIWFCVIALIAMVVMITSDGLSGEEEKSPQQLHAERVQQKITSIKNAKAFPRQISELMNPYLLSIPWRLPGWEFTKGVCTLKEPSCILSYKRLAGGTAKGLIEAFKVPVDESKVEFISLDQANIKVDRPVPEKAEDLEILFVNDLYKSFMSWCQLLTDAKYKSNLTQPSPMISPPAGYKFPKEQLIKTGDFEFSIPRTDIGQLSKIPNYLVIEEINVQIGSASTMPEFTYRGKYYAY